MGDGTYVIAQWKDNTSKTKLSAELMLPAWDKARSVENILPEITECVRFARDDLALRFASVTMAKLADGRVVDVGEESQVILALNQGQLSRQFYFGQTSVTAPKNVVSALRSAYPRDTFSLYRKIIGSTKLDSWIVEFEGPPSTKTDKLRFPGTEGGKGGAWSADIVAVSDMCPLCDGPAHPGAYGECLRAIFVERVVVNIPHA